MSLESSCYVRAKDAKELSSIILCENPYLRLLKPSGSNISSFWNNTSNCLGKLRSV